MFQLSGASPLAIATFLTFCNFWGFGAAFRPADSIQGIVRTVTRNDHPWVIANTTCVDAKNRDPYVNCYRGFLVDLLNKIKQEAAFNFTVNEYSEGNKDDKGKDTLDGTIKAIIDKQYDLALAPLSVTKKAKEVVTFSEPFFTNSKKSLSYAFPMNKNSTSLIKNVSLCIKKLKNQRYLEQLKEVWFNEFKDQWDTKKKLTAY